MYESELLVIAQGTTIAYFVVGMIYTAIAHRNTTNVWLGTIASELALMILR